jgi:redox-sensitive bicupin YhaK (pirin superfamily)
MTNLDTSPAQEVCPAAREGQGPCVQLWPEREVPLGGVRAMNVMRTLPQRGLPTVGAWCFLDSFGPDRVAMSVLPHPHCGLQTVTWPMEGAVRHRDSVGSDVVVRPGELNIMTAGKGISHSEFSVLPGTTGSLVDEIPVSRGLQLWVALPEEHRHRAPSFEQVKDLPIAVGDGFTATVMVGADITGTGQLELPLRPDFEHAVLVLDGHVVIDGQDIEAGPLAYLGAGRSSLLVHAGPSTRFMLLGGEPFGEDLLMWWNFVGRTHEEVEQAREEWEAEGLLDDDAAATSRFGLVQGHGPDAGPEAGRIPAPPLPGVKLRPRTRG